jgi:cell division transport system permease protein
MDFRIAVSRAKRSLRDDVRLHVVAIASLVIAFLCLGAALLSVENISRIAERWGGAKRLTVYLRDAAQESDVAQLRLILESLPEVKQVRYISAAEAKREFSQQVDVGVEAATLPAEAFPASLELTMQAHATETHTEELASRVRRFGAVDEVETYRDWLTQLDTLLAAGRSAVALLTLLVAVCVLAIVGNTIRLAVVQRQREIEVLKLCGATDSFVRGPFVVEGTLQGVLAASVALLCLLCLYLGLRGYVEGTFGAIMGVRMVFLPPLTALALVSGGGMIGAAGSALSLRRYLRV